MGSAMPTEGLELPAAQSGRAAAMTGVWVDVLAHRELSWCWTKAVLLRVRRRQAADPAGWEWESGLGAVRRGRQRTSQSVLVDQHLGVERVVGHQHRHQIVESHVEVEDPLGG